VTYLKQTDYIYVLGGDGGIREEGKFEDLLSHNGAFAEFIRNYLLEEEDEEAEDIECKSNHLITGKLTDASLHQQNIFNYDKMLILVISSSPGIEGRYPEPHVVHIRRKAHLAHQESRQTI
jgi:hypothetical protein